MSYITVVSPVSTFCGKTFTIDEHGNVDKSRGSVPANSVATTIPCGSLYDLQTILADLKQGEAIILGYVPECVGEVNYSLQSVRLIEKNQGNEKLDLKGESCSSDSIIDTPSGKILARLKKHFKPSGFFCLDRDIDEAAPPEIRRIQKLPAALYVKLICEDLNQEVSAAFHGADFLRVTSATGRVLMPDGSPLSTDASEHLFFQAKDADDIERFSLAFAAATVANGFFYLSETESKNGGVIHRKKFIFDTSVFTPGRLFFESNPRVFGGLKLTTAPTTYQAWLGNKVDTKAVREPSHSIQKQLEKLNLSYKGSHFESDGLHPSLSIETQEYGVMSLATYEAGDYGKLRCQSPFRESTSWAAYLNTHDDGSVYLWDEGTRTKYKLPPIDDSHSLTAMAKLVDKFRTNELANRHMAAFAVECDLEVEDDPLIRQYLEEKQSAITEEIAVESVGKVVDNKPSLSTTEEQTATLAAISQPALKFVGYSIDQLRALNLPDAEKLNLWGNRVFVEGGLTAVVGAAKVGKSSFLLYMMMCAACGKEWLGHYWQRELKVLWLQAELMLPFFLERIDQAMADFTPAQQEKIRANIITTGQFNAALNSSDQYAYKQMIAAHMPDMVIIDPLRNLTNYRSENDNAEMIETLVALRDAAKEVVPTISLVIAHHTRKIGDQKGGKPEIASADASVQFDRIAGAGSFRSMYDAGIMIMQDPQQQSTKQIHLDIRNGAPMATIEARRESESWLVEGRIEHIAKKYCNVDKATLDQVILETAGLFIRKQAAVDEARATRLSVVSIDILEYLAEKEIIIPLRRLRTILENSPLFVVFTDKPNKNAKMIYLQDTE